MDSAASTFFYALASLSTSFVGFSALIMMVHPSLGEGFSELEAWITRMFLQLGFMVTAGAVMPPLLDLCHLPCEIIWRLCSGTFAIIMLIFVVTYPARRQAVAGKPAPPFVYLDLI